MRSWIGGGVLSALLAAAPAARADVVQQDEHGFVVRVAADAAGSQTQSWRALTEPASWWASQHTFSGDAANLALDPVAGGCFCEKLPLPKDAAPGTKSGGVQHMRVIYAEPPRALRLVGAMGPLQSEAVNATLTITLKPTETGTRVLFEYVVGGYMRYKVEDIAPAVDRMLTAQVSALVARIGASKVGGVAPAAPGVVKGKAAVAKTRAPAAGEGEARAKARATFDAAIGGKSDSAAQPKR